MNVFCKAAKIIRERGWKTGPKYKKNGPVCLLQALALARDPSLEDEECLDNRFVYGEPKYVGTPSPAGRDARILMKYLPEHYRNYHNPVVAAWNFNDYFANRSDEGKPKVLSVLDAACAGEERHG